ncbi:hypothetical protein GQR58_020608 [Nymphon striatum]|nr:hypothetical protein GQR58_020608 [Nymphon striatum]
MAAVFRKFSYFSSSNKEARQYEDDEEFEDFEEEEVDVVRKICLQKRFYQHQYSLGCQPEYEASDKKKVCPIRFACQEFEAPGSTDQCHVDGKSYSPGDKVPNKNKCRECFCGQPDKKRGIPARVECAGKECEDIEPLAQTRNEECYYTFTKSDSCCPKKHCVPRGTNGTCEYNDNLFHIGQKIFPIEDPCQVCLCNSRWSGIDSSTCTQIQCDMDLERERLLEGCVPVYFQGACCPVDWVCPKGDGAIPRDADYDKCYFDGNAYDVGSPLEHNHESPCVQCRCVAPNLFTCIQEACPPPPRPRQGFQCVPKDGDKVCCPDFDCSVRIKDPCRDNDCRRDEKCMRFLEKCNRPPCKDTAECQAPDCQRVNCQRDEIYHQFGKGKGNCPWCEPKPKPRRRPARRRAPTSVLNIFYMCIGFANNSFKQIL